MKLIYKIIGYIVIVLLITGLTLLVASIIEKESNTNQDFYREWCPKLNSTIIEPRPGYSYTPRCFKQTDDNIISQYFIAKINGEYYLREIVYSS